jgi:hypothetical protein
MVGIMIWILLGLIGCFTIWFSIRNEAVYRFRSKILDACFLVTAKGIHNGEFNDCHYIYANMGSYDKMFYSFKPLKPKYWISEEDYLKIKEYYEIKSK